MHVVTIEFFWHSEIGRRLARPIVPVRTHDRLDELIDPTKFSKSEIEATARMLRTGEPGPFPEEPELLIAEQEGIHLEHSNGVCLLEHHSYYDEGCLVLRSKDLADYLDAANAIVHSDQYKDRDASFPNINVQIIDAGPEASSKYLQLGGQRRKRRRKPEETEYSVHVTRIIDGEVMWVDENTNEVIRSTGLLVDQEPEAEPANALDEVVAILGEVAVDSHDQRPVAADPFGRLKDAVDPFERLTEEQRKQLSTLLTDFERMSIGGVVLDLSERAINESDVDYLKAGAMVADLGATQHDPRDMIIQLSTWHQAATELGLDATAPTSVVSAEMYRIFVHYYDNFLVRTEAGRDLANFGLTRVEKDGRVQILPSHLV